MGAEDSRVGNGGIRAPDELHGLFSRSEAGGIGKLGDIKQLGKIGDDGLVGDLEETSRCRRRRRLPGGRLQLGSE